MDLQGAITDAELLSRYLREGDEHAFTALARRHERMVIGTAWRHLGDADLARDIAQQVFATLARKAALLTSRASLAGWLHIAATHIAARTRSAEETRRARQGQAAAQTPDRRDGNDGAQLEEALASLSETEREALVLHYFEDRSYAEMASALGLQEAAVRKRVSRALEHLGAKLRRRGICGSAVTALVGASAIQSGLPVPVAAGATLALPAAASSSFALTITTLMGNAAFKTAAAVALASALPIAWQSHANSQLQAELAEARRTAVASVGAQAAVVPDADPLRAEFAALSARLAEMRRAGEETETRLADSQRELERIQQEVLVRFGKTEDLARTIAAKLEDILPIVVDLEKKQPLDAEAKGRVERITKAAVELLPLFGQLRQLEEEPEQAARFTALVFGDVLKLPPETRAALETAVGEGYADLKRNGLTLSSRPKEHADAWVERRDAADRALTARVLATLPEEARKQPMVKMLGRYSGILLPPEIALLGSLPGSGGIDGFLKANPVKAETPRPGNQP